MTSKDKISVNSPSLQSWVLQWNNWEGTSTWPVSSRGPSALGWMLMGVLYGAAGWEPSKGGKRTWALLVSRRKGVTGTPDVNMVAGTLCLPRGQPPDPTLPQSLSALCKEYLWWYYETWSPISANKSASLLNIHTHAQVHTTTCNHTHRPPHSMLVLTWTIIGLFIIPLEWCKTPWK